MQMNRKKFIIIGECEGIPAGIIDTCLKASNAEVVFQTNQLFV